MGPGRGWGGGGVVGALGGKTLVSTNDICNIILSGAVLLGCDGLLKSGRGSGGGIYRKLYRRKRKRAKRQRMLDGGHGSRALLTLGTHIFLSFLV